jgi:hypothetical protein
MSRSSYSETIGEFARGAAALVVVFGFLSAMALTVSVGGLLWDDDSKRSRSNAQPTLPRS